MIFFKEIYINKDFYVFGLIILSFFPIMDYGVLSFSIVVFCLLAIISVKTKKQIIDFPKFIITSLFYFILIVSLLYSNMLIAGIEGLITQLPIFLFASVPLFIKVKNEHVNKYKGIILCSYIISNVILLLLIIYLILKGGYLNFFKPGFLRSIMLNFKPIELHPSYISLYFVISIFILLFCIKNTNKNKYIALAQITLASVFFFFVTLMSSKAVLISFFFSLLLLIVFFFKCVWYKKLLLFFSFLFFFFFLINFTHTLRARFETVYDEFRLPNFKNPSTTPVRVGIYNCCIKLIKDSPFFGYGIGETQFHLNECYKEYSTDIYIKRKYDSHNYYFYLLLSAGLFCLIAFMINLYYHFYFSFILKDKLYFCFTACIFVFLFAENMLMRAHGVILYSFFFTLFILFRKNE